MFKRKLIQKMKKQFKELSYNIWKQTGLRFDLQMDYYDYYKHVKQIWIGYHIIDFSTMYHYSGNAIFFKDKQKKRSIFEPCFIKELENFLNVCYKLKESKIV